MAAALSLVAGIVSLAAPAAAQEDRPQITPGERKVPRKKDAGPRALGVLQLGANGKSSLIPIAILINGKFWDASAYKADPVPMALEPGTVYEAERTGSSIGLFTVNTALHSNAANVQNPWIGTGAWVPAGTDVAKPTLKAEAAPVGIDTSDAPPRLTHNAQSAGAPASPSAPASKTPSSGGPASSGPSSSGPSGGTSGSGDEPPRLTKSTPPPSTGGGSTQTGQGQTAPSSSTPGSSTPGSTAPGSPAPGAAPTDSKPKDAKPDDRANVPVSDSGADEANRPRLRRGKPAQSFADEDVPGYSKPGASPSAANSGKIVAVAASQAPVQTIPAISDAGGPEPRSYAFEWLKDEEGERRQQIVTLAQQQLRAYLDAQAKAKIGPKPASKQTARRRPAAKAPEAILENVQMKAYDLWTNNTPVVIFSAEAHMPPSAPGSAHADTDSDLRYSIVLVAYPDIYQNFHKLYVGITDKYHLDLTPRLELVDAVDVDGDGRGELLFRETSDAGSGWVVYRATTDKLWKMFDSLNPE